MSASIPSTFDVLRPSNLIIGLIVSVLFILLSWYLFVLKPALAESNPIDMKFTKEPFSYTPFSQELKFKSGIETRFTYAEVDQSKTAFGNATNSVSKQGASIPRTDSGPPRASKKISTNSKRSFVKTKLATYSLDCHCIQREDIHRNKHEVELNDKKEFKTVAMVFKKSFLTPATEPSCTQVQIAMNQCAI